MNDFGSESSLIANKSRIPKLLGNAGPRLIRSQSLRIPRNKVDVLIENSSCGGASDDKQPKKNNNFIKINNGPTSLSTMSTSSTVPSMRNLQKTSLGSLSNPSSMSTSRTKPVVPSSLKLRYMDLDSVGSTPSSSPDGDDIVSVKSFGSACSSYSLDGTFGLQRGHTHSHQKKKNGILHCQTHYETEEEYLTPTQRKDKLIRQLKAQLMKTKREIEEKDAEITRLTQELMELRLSKPENLSKISPESLLTTANLSKENESLLLTANLKESDLDAAMSKSCDSGHFEEDNGEMSSKGSTLEMKMPFSQGFSASQRKASRNEFLNDLQEMKEANSVNEELYKIQINNLKRYHNNEYQDMKEKYNDKIEFLLQKLSENNSRYYDLRPQLDCCHEQIRKLQNKINVLELERDEQEKRHHQMYLKMYKKGQEAARFEHADEVLEFAHQAPNRVAVPELLQQLHFTENELEHLKNLYRREVYKKTDVEKDAEVTLRFLKDAIYYFLTDKDNRGHLRAIESIMGYSELERVNIERALLTRSKLLK